MPKIDILIKGREWDVIGTALAGKSNAPLRAALYALEAAGFDPNAHVVLRTRKSNAITEQLPKTLGELVRERRALDRALAKSAASEP